MQSEIEPVRQSYLHFYYSALGLGYTILLLITALVAILLTLLILIRGRGPLAAAALVLIAPTPFLIGLFGAIDGVMSSYSVIATSQTTPRPSELSMGVMSSLVTPLVGLLFSVPSYLLAVIGGTVRALTDRSGGSEGKG